MKIIIHGDDTEKSREFFFEEKNKLKNLMFLDGEGLTFDSFFQAAENKQLFDEQVCVVVENLFSKNKTNSNEFKRIIEYINVSKNLNLLVWESTEISRTSLPLLKNFDVRSFLIPRQMFTFLAQIKPGNSKLLIKLFHELIKSEAPELIFFMLIRQFRLMLQTLGDERKQIDETKKLANWQLSKLSNQARLFDKNTLSTHYNRLFEIELNQKTGKNSYSMVMEIDFFLADL